MAARHMSGTHEDEVLELNFPWDNRRNSILSYEERDVLVVDVVTL